MRRSIFCFGLTFLLSFSRVSIGGIPANIDALVKRAMQTFQVPGAAVGIVQNDSLVFAKGYGTRILGSNLPVDAQTFFAIGSISKSTVAVCLGMLVDEKRLSLDDPVTNYLPDFQLYDPWVTREITIRDLLTHRSGYISESGGTVWYGSDYDRQTIIHRLRFLKPVSSFRSRYAYQNVMYLVAGEIIPVVTGKSWDDFVRDRLFRPLVMTTTNTRLQDLAAYQNVAQPHAIINNELRVIPYRNYDNVGPAASVNSNIVEMANYVRFLLNGGRFRNQQLLSPAFARELFTPQTIVPIREYAPELARLKPNFFAYGLGWFLKDYQGYKLVYHTGGLDGMRAMVMLVPERKLGIIVLSNQEESRFYNAITYTLLDQLLGASNFDWITAFEKDRVRAQIEQQESVHRRAAERVANTKPTLALNFYTGKYFDRLYGDILVTVENGHLVLSFTHTPSFTADLEHWHYDTFRLNWRDVVIPPGFLTFQINSHGKVCGLQLDQPNLLDVDFSELEIKRVE